MQSYKKKDLLSDEFLKQFKIGEDLKGFLAQLQKRGLEVDMQIKNVA